MIKLHNFEDVDTLVENESKHSEIEELNLVYYINFIKKDDVEVQIYTDRCKTFGLFVKRWKRLRNDPSCIIHSLNGVK